MTERGRAGLWLMAAAALSALYFPLNRPWGTVHILATPWDRHIPEVPIFVIPYLLGFYGMIVVSSAWLIAKHPKQFQRLCFSLLMTEVIAYTLYLTFQSAVPRELIAHPNIFEAILNMVRNTDHIYSAFPSGHTFVTTIFVFHLWPFASRGWRIFLLINASLIIAATLLLRQHYLVDPIAGFVLAMATNTLARRWIQ